MVGSPAYLGLTTRGAARNQWVDLHIWRTWPAAEAVAAGQPFALPELAPFLLDLGRLYLEAIGPRI